jgi:hypothetical protein
MVERSRTDAYCLLQAAGLRWRTGGEHRVHSRVPMLPTKPPTDPCDEGSGSEDQGEPNVLEQLPPAGAPVSRGAIVRLEDGCTMLRALGTACL